MHYNVGENNPRWKDGDVGYDALHRYMNKRIPRPELCEICNLVPPKQLANITGIYNRELKNWKHLCKKCHYNVDREKHLTDMLDRRCSICESDKTCKTKTGRPHWRYIDGKLACNKCVQRLHYHR